MLPVCEATDQKRLLSRFVAYQAALEAFRLTAIACKRWRGYGELRAQALAAAGSVSQNLAEGNGYAPGSPKRHHFHEIAFGSALELESTLDQAASVALGDPAELRAARGAAGRAARLCTGLVRQAPEHRAHAIERRIDGGEVGGGDEAARAGDA